MAEHFPITNVPWGVRELIHAALHNPQTRPDHLLLLADWIDDLAAFLPPDSHFIVNTKRCAEILRTRAPGLPPVTD